jgi:predicted nucleic acid-binding protein
MAELYRGVLALKKDRSARINALAIFFSAFKQLEFTAPIAREFGKIHADIRRYKSKAPEDQVDVMIGATARLYGLTVVTENTRHFRALPGVRFQSPFVG